MANKRYYLNGITGSDAFAELSFEAQALYMHLSMAADDSGIVTSPKKVLKGIGASSEALKALEDSGYIMIGEDNVCKIVHWDNTSAEEDAAARARMNNRERVRRYRARRKVEECTNEDIVESEAADTKDADVTPCNADVTPCNVTVTLHTVTRNSPSFLPLSFPSLPSPTPLSITPPIIPLISSPQNSSSSMFSARAQEFSLEHWGRKLKKYEKAELRALSLDLAEEREGTEAGELCLSDEDIKLLRIAFSISADAGVCNLTYLRGIYERWHDNCIHTASDYFKSEIKRGTSFGIISRQLHRVTSMKGESAC